MQSKEWPINSIFNKHLLSIHQVLVIKDTKINLKIVPALEKLTVSPAAAAETHKETESEQRCMEILPNGWWKHKRGRC